MPFTVAAARRRVRVVFPPPCYVASVSLTDRAHRQLRADIINGRIRPNQQLVAADLAEQMQISRTPVREALKLLAADGLVVGARRGYTVREHTGGEIREIYEVRAALESMAARLVAQRGSDEQLAEIVALGAHDERLAAADRAELVDLNARFHQTLVAAAGNARLGELNGRNSEHFFNARIAALYTDAEALASVRGHADIVRALLDRAPDAAADAARDHVLEALDVLLSKRHPG